MPPPVHSAQAGAFVEKVERFAGRTLVHRREMETLLRIARDRSMKEVFGDLIFLAKFVTNASTVLKREGAGTADTAKLAQELRDSIEKCSTLLRTLIKEEPQETKDLFLTRFLALTPEGMTSFLSLLGELAWIKNYTIDTGDEI